MLTEWHRQDIFAALTLLRWDGPVREPDNCYFVGESYVFSKSTHQLHVAFVADVGTGFSTADSLEEVVATVPGLPGRAELWLSRRRDGKWHSALRDWVQEIAQIEGAAQQGIGPDERRPG